MIVASVLRNLAGVLGAGIFGVLGSGIAWLDIGILTIVVALGMAFTAAVLGRERRRSASIAGGLLAVGGLLALVLLWQAFETYFTLGDPVVVAPEQETRYVITASLTLACLVGAIVLAALSRRRRLIITACIVGCLGLIVAIAVPVPLDRFVPRPLGGATVVHEPGGGGGSCSGPGDSHCVGG